MAIRPRPPRAWVLLRDGSGGHVLDPDEPRRAAALRDLFHAAAGEGHEECSLEYGRDGGPLLHLVFTREREARLEEWAHPRDRVETVLARVQEAAGVTEEEALILWNRLAAGDVDAVRSWRWR